MAKDAFDLAGIDRAFADAALNPTLWSAALDRLSGEIGAVGAICVPIREAAARAGSVPNVLYSEPVAELVQDYLGTQWHREDLRFKVVPKILSQGIGVDSDFITEEGMRREAYYQDWLADFNLKYFVGLRVVAGDDIWCITLQRRPNDGPFSSGDQALLARLGDRVSGSATVAKALAGARHEGMADALDMSGLAVALLDARGQVLRLNRSAEALLGQGLHVSGRQLAGPDSASTRDLQRMIGSVLGTFGSSDPAGPVAIRRDGRRPLLVNAVPLTGESRLPFDPARVIITFRDLDAGPRVLTSDLRLLFGLTKAEARVAEALMAKDVAMADLSDELGVSLATLRTQLASVFRKTDTLRQSDLVKLLGRIGTREVDGTRGARD